MDNKSTRTEKEKEKENNIYFKEIFLMFIKIYI